MEEATLSAVLRLGLLARLARAHVLRHVDILAHTQGQASHQRPRLGPAKVSAKLPIVALAKHLRAQLSAARWDAQPVHSSLAPLVQQAALHHKRSAGGAREALRMAVPCLSTGLPSVAATPYKMGPKKASTTSSRTKVWTNAC
jgi:hypothetical protein